MLDVKQKNIEVAEVEGGFVFEIHEVDVDNQKVIEVWIYHKEYNTKIHAFGIMKEAVESPIKLYKHIEENMQEYIGEYEDQVMAE